MKKYIIHFIEYEDDYKHKYNNGIYPDEPIIFTDYEKAEKYRNRIIYELICLNLRKELHEIPEDLKQYFYQKDDYSIKIRKEYRNNYVILYSIYKETMKGEFVDYKFDWKFKTIDIQE